MRAEFERSVAARAVRTDSVLAGATRLAFCTVLMLAIVAFPGCGGCRKEGDEDAAKKTTRQSRLPPLTLGNHIRSQPYDRSPIQQTLVKPGHWNSTVQTVRANHRDMPIEVESYAVDSQGNRLPLDYLPHQLTVSRPGALPRGQARTIESWTYSPKIPAADGRSVTIERRIRARSGGREGVRFQQPTTAMPDYQYFFVVLADTPDRYAFLRQNIFALYQPPSDFAETAPARYYRVVIPPSARTGLPLSTHSLTWTNTAAILWDGLRPNQLNPSQQQALLDWLHWGGQLIISGPGSLEKLTGSFLEPYLPADRVAAVELKGADFQPLDEYWSLASAKTQKRHGLQVNDATPVPGISLQLREEGRMLEGCGQLVAERRVGGGRVVVTAFPLAYRTLLNWQSLDNFINGALLRHPGRKFREDEFATVEYSWSDYPAMTRDPRIVSLVRYFSRDAGSPIPLASTNNTETTDAPDTDPVPPKENWWWAGYQRDQFSGVAGWNDFSPASNAAREILREAAGISIPENSFVLRTVTLYLIVLVPLNWGFFRLIGRVEWAWVAAPLIALLASLTVVRLAQLDIGFARSRTEVSTLEIQGGYPRAHLTRYSALYTSLSTNYALEYDDETALVQPMPSDPNYQRHAFDAAVPVQLQRDRQVRLTGFSVISNSTGLVHSEQMYDLGGSLKLTGNEAQGYMLHNASDVLVRDAAAFRRRLDGQLEIAWLGDVEPHTQARLPWTPAPRNEVLASAWTEVSIMSDRGKQPGEVSLGRLVTIATQQLPLGTGDVRLVGWSDHDWEGQTIKPAASQVQTRTLIIAHLQRGPLPPPQRDVNLYSDIVSPELSALSDDDLEGGAEAIIPAPAIPAEQPAP